MASNDEDRSSLLLEEEVVESTMEDVRVDDGLREDPVVHVNPLREAALVKEDSMSAQNLDTDTVRLKQVEQEKVLAQQARFRKQKIASVKQLVKSTSPEVWSLHSSGGRRRMPANTNEESKHNRTLELVDVSQNAEAGGKSGSHLIEFNDTSASAERTGMLSMFASLATMSNQLMQGLTWLRTLDVVLALLWVLVVAVLPIAATITFRFLFSPSGSGAGSVSIGTFNWWGSLYVVLASIVHGSRLMTQEYLRARFAHRAQLSVAKGVARGEIAPNDVTTIGHHLRASRRCVMEHMPSAATGVLQTLLLITLTFTQSGKIGAGLLVVLFIMTVTHFLDNALLFKSIETLRNEAAKHEEEDFGANEEDPTAHVHRLAHLTLGATLWRAAATTVSVLVAFASPCVFISCAIDEIQDDRYGSLSAQVFVTRYFAGDTNASIPLPSTLSTSETSKTVSIEEFKLLLAFLAAMGAVVSARGVYAATRKALSTVESVMAVVDLNLGGGWTEKSGWRKGSSSRHVIFSGRSAISFIASVVILATVTTLGVSGAGVSSFGCENVKIECSLGRTSSQISIIYQPQTFSIATGCKMDATADTILAKCLVAVAPGTGYGEPRSSGSDEYDIANACTNSSGNTSSVAVNRPGYELANFTAKQIENAAAGKTASAGGLNVADLRTVLEANGLDTSGLRADLESRLSLLISAGAASVAAEIARCGEDNGPHDIDPSIRSYEDLLNNGPGVSVLLQARYINWRGKPEILTSLLSWKDVSAVASAEYDSQDVDEEDGRRQLSAIDSPTKDWRKLLGSIEFSKQVSSGGLPIRGTTDYTLCIHVSSQRYAGSKDTLSVQLMGATGIITNVVVLGDSWEKGSRRVITLKKLAEVGEVIALSITTNGKNGVFLDKIVVSHVEDPSKAPPQEKPVVADAPAVPEEALDVGSEVLLLSGKYEGCQGSVKKFSPKTGKPQVCRVCSMQSKGGVGCCSSSTCSYLSTDKIELIPRQEATAMPPAPVSMKGGKTTLAVGSSVVIESGKYTGCHGTIKLFSPATDKPKVCRDCGRTGTGGQPCCGSTTATKCSYYRHASISLNEPPLQQKPIEHKSYFSFDTTLRCEGAKTKGTWSCSTTLVAKRPIEDTTDNEIDATPSTSGSVRVIPSTMAMSQRYSGPLQYRFGKLWIDKAARGVSRFEYVARRDAGNFDRHGAFKIDPRYKNIQQTTGRAYPKYCLAPFRNGKPWSTDGMSSTEIKDQCVQVIAHDRGHLIPANHFDHDKDIIEETNLMINILPQVDKMNRGAWLQTEMIIECLREEEVVTVIGGAVYPPSSEKGKRTSPAEFFHDSHGVITPTHFWKIIAGKANGIHASDNGLIAFWIPNAVEATAANTAKYVVSITKLEQNLKAASGLSPYLKGWPAEAMIETFDLPQSVKDHVPSLWNTLEGCDRA